MLISCSDLDIGLRALLMDSEMFNLSSVFECISNNQINNRKLWKTKARSAHLH